MKEIIRDDELRQVILDATNLICDAVGSTLGPKGNNVIINSDDKTPFITNDGVTIASSIVSSNKRINTILEIIKEATLKTNEKVGDGTTTTLVLLKKIIEEGIKAINNGKNSIILKKDLEIAKLKVIDFLNNEKKNPTKKDLFTIASISANDEEIGQIITEVFLKMKSKNAIKLDYSRNNNTYYEIKNGYSIELDNIPILYLNNIKKLELKNVYILIINSYLENLEKINFIINESIERNKNIIILADDFDNNILKEIISIQMQYNKNIYLFKLPDYASRKMAIASDIALISSSTIKNLIYENLTWNDLGFVDKVIIDKHELIFINNSIDIDNRILVLKNELLTTNSEYDKDFLKERIAKMENGIATIFVGGITNTEIKEKIMRFEDALNALEIAKKGVIVGEGISFLKSCSILSSNNTGENILKSSLQAPFLKILDNAGLDSKLLMNHIIDSNYKYIYNFNTDKLDNINITKILDPIDVEIEALNNAISIASMLLTTNYLIINDSFQKENIEF